MRFHNRAIDQVQTVARFCRQRIENTLPDSSPRPAVEPIVRARVRAVAFGQIAPRDPGPQHVKYCIYDPSVVRARALPALRHQRLENRPFLIAEIESHDPPPPAVNHDPGCFSVNYAGTDPRQPRYHESGSPYYLHTHRRLALRFYRLSFRKMRWTSWRAWIFRHARSPQCKSPNESNRT